MSLREVAAETVDLELCGRKDRVRYERGAEHQQRSENDEQQDPAEPATATRRVSSTAC